MPAGRAAPGIFAACLAAVASSIHAWPAEPAVRIGGETLTGAHGAANPQVASYKGIPFAEPPIGDLRWRAPAPRRAHSGLRRALHFAPACYQDSYNTDWYRRVGAAFGAGPAIFPDPPVSEDCLYLNVWTPAPDARAALPVMVWIHGGANRSGWSFEPNYLGERLAARGQVVVVSIAYRLGVFGFFGHPQLRDTNAPSNFGLLDQVAALHWVHDHIGAFGGDPDNVTVFGESAGAAGIGYLLASPLAGGLFRRAISESGGYQMLDDLRLRDAERVGLAISNALPGRPDLAGLRRLDSTAIFNAGRAALAGHDFAPVMDGKSLLAPPASTYRSHGIHKDLLIGTNEDEWYMYVDDQAASLEKVLQELPAAVRGPIAERAAREPDLRRAQDKATTLVNMVCPAYLMASAAAGGDHSAWVYRFTRVRPGAGGEQLLAYHGAEIPYVFDTHDQWLPGDAVETALTDAMLHYWSNFARTGDPNGESLPPWPAFASGNASVMELGTRIGPMPAPDGALCRQVAGDLYPSWKPSQPGGESQN